MFEVKLLPDAEAAFKKLDRAVQTRIGKKIDWLSENAAVMVHHPLISQSNIRNSFYYRLYYLLLRN